MIIYSIISSRIHSKIIPYEQKINKCIILMIFRFYLKAIYLNTYKLNTAEEMHSDLSQGQPSAAILKQYEYTRPMGSYKPHFQGIPEEYFPLDCWEVTKYSIYVIFLISATLGIMIGFLYWVLATGLNGYIIAWSVIWLAFAAMMMVLFFFGGKSRIKEEKRLIIEQQKKQQQMKNKANRKKFESKQEQAQQ